MHSLKHIINVAYIQISKNVHIYITNLISIVFSASILIMLYNIIHFIQTLFCR